MIGSASGDDTIPAAMARGDLVLATTLWKIRKAVKVVNEVLGSLCLLKHSDKTFIGRIEKGFDFLGYHFSPDGLCVAKKTV